MKEQALLNSLREQFETYGKNRSCDDVEREEMWVEMQDGVKLFTVVFRPKGEEKLPTLLQRTCYPHTAPMAELYGREFAKLGYACMYQFCRGTGQSKGIWEPNVNERRDGLDTVEWLYRQDWVDGIGYFGMSYGALGGWAMADAVEGKVDAMFLSHYGTDRFISAYQNGAFKHDILTSWTMENAGFLIHADYLDSCSFMPQLEVDEKLWGRQIDWYRDYLRHDKETDDYWQQGFWKQLRDIPGKVKIPLYVVDGWYDHHHESCMKTWERLNLDAKKKSWLEIGGWNHFYQPVLEDKEIKNINNSEVQKMITWFDLTLRQKQMPKARVNYYIPAKDCWKTVALWENREIKKTVMFLDADTKKQVDINAEKTVYQLTAEPVSKAAQAKYIYNPQNPVPTDGGDCVLKNIEKVGSRLKQDAGWREDVICFLSNPLTEEKILCGKMQVELWVKTDCEDTAFLAELMQVTTAGKSYHIRSAITTLAAGMADGGSYQVGTAVRITLEMADISYAIAKGERLRLDIRSSDFPQFHIHRNFKDQWAACKRQKNAHQTVLTGGIHLSKITLMEAYN